MTKLQLAEEIKKIEAAIDSKHLPEEAKGVLRKNLLKLKSQLETFEKEEADKQSELKAKEVETHEDVESKISKLKRLLSSPNILDVTKTRIKKQIEDAEAEIEKQKAEIEKAEKESKKETEEIKEAVKEVEAKIEEKIEAIEKPVVKKVVKKVKVIAPKKAKKVEPPKEEVKIEVPKIKEKEREDKSKKRKTKISEILTSLERLINKNKNLSKYRGSHVDLEIDSKRSAKPFGYRFRGKHDYRIPDAEQIKRGKKRGTVYFEARPDHSDKYPQGYRGKIKLEKGGDVGNLWYAIKEHNDWEENTQHKLTGVTWEEAYRKAKTLANEHKKEVRLSTSEGYNNQGHYVYYDYAKGGEIYTDNFKEVEDSGSDKFYIRKWATVTDDRDVEIELVVFAEIMDLEDKVSYEELPEDGNFKLNIDLIPTSKFISKSILKEANNEDNSCSSNSIVNVVNYMGGLVYAPENKSIFKSQAEAEEYLHSKELNEKISTDAIMAGFFLDKSWNMIGQTNWDRLDYITGVSKKFAEGGEVHHDKYLDGERTAKPQGWRWKDDAVTLGVISKAGLLKSPSEEMRELYPELVYQEKRLSKSDKNPSSKYISLEKGGTNKAKKPITEHQQKMKRVIAHAKATRKTGEAWKSAVARAWKEVE